ncbi:MAG TPA: TonB-dependent receptor [Chitinophagaceae bacterium]|nr:TonB-dependent receptor [Chitinophagaceae bacterium]
MLPRKIILTACILLFALAGIAQAGADISGTVVEKGKLPIEFASVLLLQLPDSANAGAAITDDKGRFIFEKIPPGNYVLRITFIGLNALHSKPFSIDANIKKLTLGQFDLSGGPKELDEVVVAGKKSMMNTSIDRKVYNVDQDIMNKTGTASDILKNIPSVEVDLDGVVSLRGSSDVMILINGKPTPLMGRSRAEVLQQLPAGSIERIEIITNPSARYRPDGTSGIINIVLKKNTKNGFNGTVTANAGNRHRYNGNLALNYNPRKINLFGTYSARQDTRIRYNSIDRTLIDSSGRTYLHYDEENYSRMRPVIVHVVNGGINYTIDERNSLDVSGSYYTRRLTRNEVINRSTFDAQRQLTEHYDRWRQGPDSEWEKLVTIAYQREFAGEDHSLNVEFTAESTVDKEDNRFTNIYFYPAAPRTFDNTIIKEAERQRQLTIDYTNQLTEQSRLQAGYDGSYNDADLDFYGEAYDISLKQFIMDSLRSNRFMYKEHLHAVYGTYQRDYERFGYSVGVRLEQAMIKGHLTTIDSSIDNRYFKVYPTIHLSYKLGDDKELQLNYSKRVNRPDADELNPFPTYQDPRNLSAGNPALLPEIIHSVEFGFKWQNHQFSFVPSLYYRYEKDGFTTVTIPLNDSVLLTTEQNLSNDQSAGLEMIFSAKAGKWLNANLSSNIFYNRINAVNLGYGANKSIVSASTTLNVNMNFGKGSMMQFMINHRSARLTPQGRVYPAVSMNGGFRQDLLKGKLSVTLTVSDILKSLRQKNAIETPYFHQTSIGRRDGRIIYFGISYRFGVKKNVKEEIEFDDNL